MEKVLFEWLQCMKKKKAKVTEDPIEEISTVFWDKLSQYEEQSNSSFPTGWLEGFKGYNSIKKYRLYGEAKTVDLVIIEEKLQEMSETVQLYDNKEVYNMDQSVLF